MSRSALTPVPLSGFLCLPAVSKRIQSLRACFIPLPFVGPPFRVFPSQESRTPLEAASSPAVIHPRASGYASDLVTARFRDSHALQRSRLLPRTAMSSLSTRPKPCFPITLDPSRRTRSFRQLHPLRSLIPPASPTPPTRGFPRLGGRSSLGFLASLECFPQEPRLLRPATACTATRPRPTEVSHERDPRDLATPRPG